ncbi:hypothetical protein FISHEDRAFT_73849 [Fistulina hepatica ATCC 64428]|uniref:Uncharacterized protein n=1 Tax=Fistulina hepatica ATCC 64428 TaxID=1128425 RepID=A0A0D7AC86_9AGAR|nr:hypothetical protein FISHEDRAFT_73849 [Fistulina hepatica ATCC 64428]
MGDSLEDPQSSRMFAELLGIQPSTLRIQDHSSATKPHLVLRQVSVPDDSGSGTTVYYGFFAQKPINVKPGREILFCIPASDGSTDQAMMLVAEPKDAAEPDCELDTQDDDSDEILMPRVALRRAWVRDENRGNRDDSQYNLAESAIVLNGVCEVPKHAPVGVSHVSVGVQAERPPSRSIEVQASSRGECAAVQTQVSSESQPRLDAWTEVSPLKEERASVPRDEEPLTPLSILQALSQSPKSESRRSLSPMDIDSSEEDGRPSRHTSSVSVSSATCVSVPPTQEQSCIDEPVEDEVLSDMDMSNSDHEQDSSISVGPPGRHLRVPTEASQTTEEPPAVGDQPEVKKSPPMDTYVLDLLEQCRRVLPGLIPAPPSSTAAASRVASESLSVSELLAGLVSTPVPASAPPSRSVSIPPRTPLANPPSAILGPDPTVLPNASSRALPGPQPPQSGSATPATLAPLPPLASPKQPQAKRKPVVYNPFVSGGFLSSFDSTPSLAHHSKPAIPGGGESAASGHGEHITSASGPGEFAVTSELHTGKVSAADKASSYKAIRGEISSSRGVKLPVVPTSDTDRGHSKLLPSQSIPLSVSAPSSSSSIGSMPSSKWRPVATTAQISVAGSSMAPPPLVSSLPLPPSVPSPRSPPSPLPSRLQPPLQPLSLPVAPVISSSHNGTASRPSIRLTPVLPPRPTDAVSPRKGPSRFSEDKTPQSWPPQDEKEKAKKRGHRGKRNNETARIKSQRFFERKKIEEARGDTNEPVTPPPSFLPPLSGDSYRPDYDFSSAYAAPLPPVSDEYYRLDHGLSQPYDPPPLPPPPPSLPLPPDNHYHPEMRYDEPYEPHLPSMSSDCYRPEYDHREIYAPPPPLSVSGDCYRPEYDPSEPYLDPYFPPVPGESYRPSYDASQYVPSHSEYPPPHDVYYDDDGEPVVLGVKRSRDEDTLPRTPPKRVCHGDSSTRVFRPTFSRTLEGSQRLNRIVISDDGEFIAFACSNKSVHIWANDRKTQLVRLFHKNYVTQVSWEQHHLYVLLADGRTGKWTKVLISRFIPSFTFCRLCDSIPSVQHTHSSFTYRTQDPTKTRWTWSLLFDGATRGESAETLYFATSCNKVALSSPRTGLRIWQQDRGMPFFHPFLFADTTPDRRNPAEEWNLRWHFVDLDVTAVAFFHGGQSMLCGTKSKGLHYFDFCRPSPVRCSPALTARKIVEITVSSDETTPTALVTTSVGSAYLVQCSLAPDIVVQATFSVATSNGCLWAKFSPDGMNVLTRSSDGQILVWDVDGRGMICSLEDEDENDQHRILAVSGPERRGRGGYMVTGTVEDAITWWERSP